MNQNSAAATRKTTTVALGEAGAPALPWAPAFAGAGAAFAATGLAGGAAEAFGGGGGHVIVPSLITVVPRITSSSILTSSLPSFALHNSSLRRRRLVAYSVLDCLARRLGR